MYRHIIWYTLLLSLSLALSASGVIGLAAGDPQATVQSTDAGPRPGPGPLLVWEGQGL